MTVENVLFEQDGFKATLVQDENAESPREANDCYLGRMLCFHKQYKLGDNEKVLDIGPGAALSDVHPRNYDGWVDMESHLCDPANGYEIAVCLNLYLYDHGGISMSTGAFGCRWDSGQVGFIVATEMDVLKEYGNLSQETLAKVQRQLVAEVEEYDHYLRGNVHGIVVEDANGEEVDSCWGFIGCSDDPDFVEQAKGMVECAIDDARRKAARKATLDAALPAI